MTNNDVAKKLQEHARTLRQRNENLYRVKAYRHAAEMLRRLDRPIEEIVQKEGRKALAEIPWIGRHLAQTIATLVQTGEWRVRH